MKSSIVYLVFFFFLLISCQLQAGGHKEIENSDELAGRRILDAGPVQVAAGNRTVEKESQQMTMGNHLSASRTGKTNRGDRFMAVRQGEIVLDTKTKLMWAAKDNGSDTSWKNALNYCSHYRGGGYTDWRMPTLDELAGLYDAEKTQPNEAIPSMPLHLSESINLSSCCIWAAEARGTGAAYFNFNTGLRNWTPHARDTAGRALPVRSGK